MLANALKILPPFQQKNISAFTLILPANLKTFLLINNICTSANLIFFFFLKLCIISVVHFHSFYYETFQTGIIKSMRSQVDDFDKNKKI